jgi:pimeloyl-ACP methyl ester carboxylesterase
MRKILTNHIGEDIKDNIKKIKCPALLIWGTNDQAVDIKEAYLLDSLLSDSGIVEYQGCTHYAYLERLSQTISVLKSFFNN